MRQPPLADSPLASLRLGRALPVGLFAVAVAVVLAWRFLPMRADLLMALAVAAVGLLVAGSVVRALVHAYGSEESSYDEVVVPEPSRSYERPRELVQIEGIITAATASATDAHLRLRPLLRAILVARLTDPDASEAAGGDPRAAGVDATLSRRVGELSERLWELVRPGRRRPAEWNEPGVDLGSLRSIVEELEG